MNQMSLFDFMPTLMVEPEVGEYVKECGAVIPHIMRKGYIGKKVLVDKSEEYRGSEEEMKLEKIVPARYWGDGAWIECERSIVYTGEKQRSLISHYPWVPELREVLPWDAYERREDVIHHR